MPGTIEIDAGPGKHEYVRKTGTSFSTCGYCGKACYSGIVRRASCLAWAAYMCVAPGAKVTAAASMLKA